MGDGTLTDASALAGPTPDPLAILRSRSFIAVLALAAVIGFVVSFVSWAFLELMHYTQQWLFTDLPDDFGWDYIPRWRYLVALGVAGEARRIRPAFEGTSTRDCRPRVSARPEVGRSDSMSGRSRWDRVEASDVRQVGLAQR